jgi:hypothetical protein
MVPQQASTIWYDVHSLVGTGGLQIMIVRVGAGWYFTILAGACATPLPFLILQWRKSLA